MSTLSDLPVLRLAAPSRLISAAVFEDLFDRHHGRWFRITREAHDGFFTRVLGPVERPFPDPKALALFRETTRPYAFICPGFQSTRLIPLLLDLRNRSGAEVRLLFINHSPGGFAYIFSLLSGILRPGDLIVAPSRSSARVITALAPKIAPYVHAVHHPMAETPQGRPAPKTRPIRIVTLGRLVPEKLIHLQVEAFALLVEKYGRDAEMLIAGETRNLDTGRRSVYVRSLDAAIKRLGLAERVVFTGVIGDPEEKAGLLASADLMLYLSATLEEAFPKAAVEGLGAGLPVVGTHWDGFPEVVGDCGRLVRFHPTETSALAISPDEIAHAMDRCLAAPPSADACRKQAARFSPASARTGYEKAVSGALSKNPQDSAFPVPHLKRRLGELTGPGLLAGLPFLRALSLRTALAEYRAYTRHIRGSWETGRSPDESDAGCQTDLLTAQALKRKLEYQYAGLKVNEIVPQHPAGNPDEMALCDRIAWALPPQTDRDTAGACILRLMALDQPGLLKEALGRLPSGNFDRASAYAGAWLLLRQNRPKEALDLYLSQFAPDRFQAHEGSLLSLLEEIRRLSGANEKILTLIKGWLVRYPDSPGSGLVWMDYAAALGDLRGWEDPEALSALVATDALLGNLDAVRRLKERAMAVAVAVEDET